jgi:tRNA/tmRNA/rRNA uracil-C5-methylase (TrmA/RlmC/RlmD family)
MNIWDPYCGNGVILRTIAVLHRPRVCQLYASDIRSDAVEQTRANISICSTLGYSSNDEFGTRYKCKWFIA